MLGDAIASKNEVNFYLGNPKLDEFPENDINVECPYHLYVNIVKSPLL